MKISNFEHSAKLRFSLVVVHRNGQQRLLDFLDSAYAVIDTEQDEIIVIDNHSTDDSLEIAIQHYPHIQIIRNQYNSGYAYACNQGIQLSQGHFILICNNDLRLPNSILDRLIDDFTAYPNTGMIGGQLINHAGNRSTSAGPATSFLTELGFKRKLKYQENNPGLHKVDTIVGACMAVRRSTIASAGGLDSDFFFYYEETEWCMRISRHGWDIMLDPSIEIVHTGGASTEHYFKAARIELFRSRLLFWKKTMPSYAVYILYAWHIPKLVISVLIYLIINLLSLHRNNRIKNKLLDKINSLTWLLLGCPNEWGLPDKKPEIR